MASGDYDTFEGLMINNYQGGVWSILDGTTSHWTRYAIGQTGNSSGWINDTPNKLITIATSNGNTVSDWVELYVYIDILTIQEQYIDLGQNTLNLGGKFSFETYVKRLVMV